MKQSNSTTAHSADQAKETDVDVADGEGWWGDSGVAGHEHRGKGDDDIEYDEGPTRLRENRDW